MKPRIPMGHLIGSLVALAIPSAAALGILVLEANLAPLAALGGFTIIVLGLWVVLRPALLALTAARRHAELLALGAGGSTPAEPPDAAVRLPIAQEIARATTALAAAERARRQEIDALTATRAALLDVLPDAILGVGGDGRVRLANAAARQMLGPNSVGRDVGAVLRAPSVLEALQASLRDRTPRETEWHQVGAVERSYVVRALPIPATPDGITLVAAMSEVTDRRRAERLRADFIANASHELRTPLATLLGFIETLRGPARDDPEAHSQFLEIMHEQAQRMGRLVEDLLSLSRIEQSEHVPPTEAVTVADLLGQVQRGLILQAERRSMTLVVDVADDTPAVVGAEREVAQLCQNLIENAIKYGRPGTRVLIQAKPAKDLPPGFPKDVRRAVVISVTDRGDGIAREHLPRLTERFYRVDVGRSREAGGTGLGLAIVKHIVTRHRGVLSIESEVGVGSRFSVHLPAVANPSA